MLMQGCYVEVVNLILLLRYHPNLVPVFFSVLISLHIIPFLKILFIIPNNYDDNFASFATCLDMNRHVCIETYLHVLPEISPHHLQLKCIGGHFFSRAIPTQRVLPYSLIYININKYIYKLITIQGLLIQLSFIVCSINVI